jgi:hypothetical protein
VSAAGRLITLLIWGRCRCNLGRPPDVAWLIEDALALAQQAAAEVVELESDLFVAAVTDEPPKRGKRGVV